MERTEIVSLYKNTPADGTVVTVCGWAKNIRDSKNIGFIALSDGGCFKTLQVVLEAGKLANYEEVIHTGLYSSLRIVGRIVLTPQAKQPFELNADSVEILGDCPADEYPLQKKKMSMEYLRTMPTLRPRTNTFNAAFRVRSVAAYAIHKFFQENGFIYSHSPLLTASDCEGAGEMFQVTTLDLQNVPKNEDGTVDYSQDFFEKPVNLTVSGQLEAEAMAMALGNVYTFGPTFRAEKSYTNKHSTEFSGFDLEFSYITSYRDVMKMEEELLPAGLKAVKEAYGDQIKELFGQEVIVPETPFPVVKLADLYKGLEEEFGYTVDESEKGDLTTEAERLSYDWVKKHYNHEFLFVTDYDAEKRAFYHMRDENGVPQGYDLIWRGVEITTGAQREHRYEVLKKQAEEKGLAEDVKFYLEFFQYGCPPHGGFGLGIDRLTMLLVGESIKDAEFLFRGPNRLTP